MITVDKDILAGFDTTLKIRRVPPALCPEYRKWLRYFLDFQSKYPQAEGRSVQVQLFSEKLRSKGQTEAQVYQAADAVSLFFAHRQKRPVASSRAVSGAVPSPILHRIPEQSRGVDALPHVSGVKKSGLMREPPGPPVSDEPGNRRKGRFESRRLPLVVEIHSLRDIGLQQQPIGLYEHFL